MAIVSVHVMTSAKSLARGLWSFGEDELWPQAMVLGPEAVAGLAAEFGRLRTDPAAVQRIWPGAPDEAFLLIPVIEHLEGRRRPAARSRRRPRSAMPAILHPDLDDPSGDPGFDQVRSLVEAETSRARPQGAAAI
jgi:hypothetical protein